MPCIALPEIDLSPPGLDLLLPELELPIPTFGLSLCCTIALPPLPSIIIPFGAISGLAVILQPLITLIQTVIKTLNAILSQIQMSCPLE